MSDSSDRRSQEVAAESREDDVSVSLVRYSGQDQVSLLEVLSALLRRRYSILTWTMVIGALAVIHLLITFSPTYTSNAAFSPQGPGQGNVSGLEAVAGRFGINIPTGTESRSPEFYEDLLGSREILRPLLSDTFAVREGRDGEGPVTGTIPELLDLDSIEEAARREAGIDWVRDAISTNVRQTTGVVDFSVTTPWPELSEAIAHRLLDRVNEFNLETRQSRAAAERRFIEARLEEAEAELRVAEDALKRFLETNRQFQNSPELSFEHERLERRVAMRQELYTSLNQSYEQARISEVRNTPLITVLEPPEEPVRRDPRGLKRRALLGLIFGGVLGVIAALAYDFGSRMPREASEEYREFRRALDNAIADIRRLAPWRKSGGRH